MLCDTRRLIMKLSVIERDDSDQKFYVAEADINKTIAWHYLSANDRVLYVGHTEIS